MAGQLSPVEGSSWSDRASRSVVRRLMWPAAAIGLGLVLITGSFDTSAQTTAQGMTQGTTSAVPPVVAQAPEQDAAAEEKPAMPPSAPTRLSIPAIGVDAPFTGLAIGKSGQLDAPPAADDNLVGWFKDGVAPGARGTAIVAGHVDTKTGPAVFAQLSTVLPGTKIDIKRKDGTTAYFLVDSVESFSKANFPNDRVYADAPDAQLRLITCGGDYDHKVKDYTENVVVFAHLDAAA
ncbi:class F sortase [Streptomyces sp. NPDC006475]|uniref:class F sortase n=1 Tax=Streptomyces sp. NPDC006475 TaxID=3155719 RepID=UPI0033BB07A0